MCVLLYTGTKLVDKFNDPYRYVYICLTYNIYTYLILYSLYLLYLLYMLYSYLYYYYMCTFSVVAVSPSS